MEQDNLHSLESLLDMIHQRYNHCHPKLNRDFDFFFRLNLYRYTYSANESDGSIDDNEEDTIKKIQLEN